MTWDYFMDFFPDLKHIVSTLFMVATIAGLIYSRIYSKLVKRYNKLNDKLNETITELDYERGAIDGLQLTSLQLTERLAEGIERADESERKNEELLQDSKQLRDSLEGEITKYNRIRQLYRKLKRQNIWQEIRIKSLSNNIQEISDHIDFECSHRTGV